MRIILFATLILPMLFSCSGENASYEKDSNFDRFTTSQLVEQVVQQNLDDQAFEALRAKARADVSWTEFWDLLIKNKLALSKSSAKVRVLLRAIAGICPAGAKDLIFSSFVDSLESNIESLTIINLINSKCTGDVSPTTKALVRKFMKQGILSNESLKDIKPQMNKVLKIDEDFNKSLPFGVDPEYTLSAQEFAYIGEKLLELDKDISVLSRILEIHRNLYPNSSKFRQKLVKTYLGDINSLKEIVKSNSINDMVEFLSSSINNSEYTLETESTSMLIETLISKIDKRYNREDPFSKNGNLMEEFLNTYFKLFNTIKYIKATELEPKKLIKLFNESNKVAESIMLYDEQLSISLLDKYEGADKILADFHRIRIQNKAVHRLQKNDVVYKVSDLVALDQLLIYRNKLLKGDSSAIEPYCMLLASDFGFPEKSITLKAVETNLDKIGCFKVITKSNLPKDSYDSLTLTGKRLESNYDTLFQISDTDLSLDFEYYNGPVWIISSNRNQGMSSFKLLESLDAQMIPLVMKVEVSKKIPQGLDVGTHLIAYNFNLKQPENAPHPSEFDLKLRPGFRGGNFNLETANPRSMLPVVINNGGKGEKAPGPILAGIGFDVEGLENRIYDELTIDPGFVDPGLEFYIQLIKTDFKNINITVDMSTTQKLSAILCGAKFCKITGKQMPVAINEDTVKSVVEPFREDVTKLAITVLKSFYEQKFHFPPSIDEKKGKTIFEDGVQGENGNVIMNGIEIQK